MIIHAHTDGASRGNPGESGIGVIFHDEGGSVLFSAGGYIGQSTNNLAEYEALLFCLRKAKDFQCEKLVVYSDSELMVRQLQGRYRVKNKAIQERYQQARQLLANASFVFEILHVERGRNKDADLLANAGIDSKERLPL